MYERRITLFGARSWNPRGITSLQFANKFGRFFYVLFGHIVPLDFTDNQNFLISGSGALRKDRVPLNDKYHAVQISLLTKSRSESKRKKMAFWDTMRAFATPTMQWGQLMFDEARIPSEILVSVDNITSTADELLSSPLIFQATTERGGEWEKVFQALLEIWLNS